MGKSKHLVPSAGAHATSPAEWVHVDDLKPNPRNPRRHGQEVLRLAKTILRTTWGAPILAQRATRRIIGGHGRLEAAREILAGIEVDGELRGGHEHVFAHGAPGPGFVPVRWLDVSDAEADAMTLADNARGLQGEDDAVLIAQMAAQFGRESELMRDIGYSAEALDRMIAGAGDAILRQGSAPTPSDGKAVDDLSAEWEGMPEFTSNDMTSHSRIIVHFGSEADEAAFLALVGATVRGGVNGSRTIWYPPQDDKERDAGRFSDREYRS